MSEIIFKGETFQIGEDQAKKIVSEWASIRFGFSAQPPVELVNCKAQSIIDKQPKWIEWDRFGNDKPKEDIYIVESNRGVHAAWYSDFSGRFQDCGSNDDEGMTGWDEDKPPFKVFRYQAMPKGKEAV